MEGKMEELESALEATRNAYVSLALDLGMGKHFEKTVELGLAITATQRAVAALAIPSEPVL